MILMYLSGLALTLGFVTSANAAEEIIGPKLPSPVTSSLVGPTLPEAVYTKSETSAAPKLTEPPEISKRPEREPLYRFSFDGGINYQSTLLQVVQKSIIDTPTAHFDVVSYIPVTGDLSYDQDLAAEAYHNAKQVYDYLVENGLLGSKINVRYTTNSGSSTNDIAIFAVAPQN
jgi:hypothetical protein